MNDEIIKEIANDPEKYSRALIDLSSLSPQQFSQLIILLAIIITPTVIWAVVFFVRWFIKRNDQIRKDEIELKKHQNIETQLKQHAQLFEEFKNMMSLVSNLTNQFELIIEKLQYSISVEKLEILLDSQLGITRDLKKFVKSKILTFVDFGVMSKYAEADFTNIYTEFDTEIRNIMERLRPWTFKSNEFYISMEKYAREKVIDFLTQIDDMIQDNAHNPDLNDIIRKRLDDRNEGIDKLSMEIKTIILDSYKEKIVSLTDVNYTRKK